MALGGRRGDESTGRGKGPEVGRVHGLCPQGPVWLQRGAQGQAAGGGMTGRGHGRISNSHLRAKESLGVMTGSLGD